MNYLSLPYRPKLTPSKLFSVDFAIFFRIPIPQNTLRSSRSQIFLKISQYPQENTYVGVFNKVAGLLKRDFNFFCEYCKIFLEPLFYRTPLVAASVPSSSYFQTIFPTAPFNRFWYSASLSEMFYKYLLWKKSQVTQGNTCDEVTATGLEPQPVSS